MLLAWGDQLEVFKYDLDPNKLQADGTTPVGAFESQAATLRYDKRFEKDGVVDMSAGYCFNFDIIKDTPYDLTNFNALVISENTFKDCQD